MNITADQERLVLEDVNHPHQLFKIPGVTAYYPGLKKTNGVQTNQECLVVCVDRKKSSDTVSDDQLIPRFINNTITDVVQLPQIRKDMYCGGTSPEDPFVVGQRGCDDNIYKPGGGLYRDLPGGVSISPSADLATGTLGIMVKDKKTRRVVGLTCNHVVGVQVYSPPRGQVIETYQVHDDGINLRIINPTTNTSYIKPVFGNQFPSFVNKGLYKFDVVTDLHEFYITRHSGGGGLKPVTSVTIMSGDKVRYSNGIGTGTAAASAGESLYFNNYDNDETVYYGSYTYPNVGGQIKLSKLGVPPCMSVNRERFNNEYYDGQVKNKHVSLIGNKLAYPSNVDIDDSKQVLLGAVYKSSSIKFCHPDNIDQPTNKIDAAVIDINTQQLQAKSGVVGIYNKPIEVAQATAGAHVFKSGRTTGVTPQNAVFDKKSRPSRYTNPCEIVSTTATVNINFCSDQQTIQKNAIFDDCILYEQSNEWFSTTGDSGSAILMKDSTDQDKLKLVGIHMSGSAIVNAGKVDYSWGIACKIQNIFQQLGLETWEGTLIVPVDAECIKIDKVCYSKREMATVRPTHILVDETYDDCADCVDD